MPIIRYNGSKWCVNLPAHETKAKLVGTFCSQTNSDKKTSQSIERAVENIESVLATPPSPVEPPRSYTQFLYKIDTTRRW
jgi:hypothetical protein